jgi:hypothetical protein
VRNLGVTEPGDFFTDHVDLRPTIMLPVVQRMIISMTAERS